MNTIDPRWYLANYPDVGHDLSTAVEHYLRHGVREGRYPRPLKSLLWERRLWQGFKTPALRALDKLARDAHAADESAYAVYALCNWYANDDLSKIRESYVDSLRAVRGFLSKQKALLLKADLLTRLNRATSAQGALASYDGEHSGCIDLAVSNAASNYVGRDQYDRQPYAQLNQEFARSGLAQVCPANENEITGLDNITANIPPATMTGALVTVIIAAYNAESTLRTAVQSIVKQSWKNLQIIIVDDSSTDLTHSIALAFSKSDPRVAVLRSAKRSGSYACRNLALSISAGTYVTTMDADDWSHPQRVEKSIESLEGAPGAVGTLTNWVRAERTLYFRRHLSSGAYLHYSVSTLLTKTSIVKDLGGWDEVVAEGDSALLIKLRGYHGRNSVLTCPIPAPLVIAEARSDSLTSSSKTHIKTEHYGARHIYRELCELRFNNLNKFASFATENPPAYVPKVLTRLSEKSCCYDIAVVGDFSIETAASKEVTRFAEHQCTDVVRMAVIHTGDISSDLLSPKICPTILELALRGRLFFVVHGETIKSKVLMCFCRPQSKLPDELPHISYDDLVWIDPDSYGKSAREVSEMALVTSGLFSSEWYLDRYPDVRASGSAAVTHFSTNGLQEGRHAGFAVDSAGYGAEFSLPYDSLPFVHYLRVGRYFNVPAQQRIVKGYKVRNPSWPTVLVCGHASGKHLFGAERSLLDVLRSLESMAVNVSVLLPEFGNPEYVRDISRHVESIHCVKYLPWIANRTVCDVAKRAIKEILVQHCVKLVHLNSVVIREPAFAARELGIPVIVHAREAPTFDLHLQEQLGLPGDLIVDAVFSWADVIVANSGFTREVFRSRENVRTIYNCVNIESTRTEHNSLPRIGMLASPSLRKGWTEFLDLSLALASDWELFAYGVLPDSDVGMVLKKNPAIHICGYVDDPKLALEKLDVLLVLSESPETFGRTVIEAMQCRCLVAAYAHGAIPELIEDGINGILVANGDKNALLARLADIRVRRDELSAMTSVAWDRASRFSLSQMTLDIVELYGSLLGTSASNKIN